MRYSHYGRYVDDAYIVSEDEDCLKDLIPKIRDFLHKELHLTLHANKTRIYNAYHGVEFLGAYVKPFRSYVSSSTLKRIKRKVKSYGQNDCEKLPSSVNSFLGVFSHYKSYCLRRVMFGNDERLKDKGKFDTDYLKFKPYC